MHRSRRADAPSGARDLAESVGGRSAAWLSDHIPRRAPELPMITRAEQLFDHEQEEAALARRMQEDQIRRTHLRDEILRLRCSLTQQDADQYAQLKEGPR